MWICETFDGIRQTARYKYATIRCGIVMHWFMCSGQVQFYLFELTMQALTRRCVLCFSFVLYGFTKSLAGETTD